MPILIWLFIIPFIASAITFALNGLNARSLKFVAVCLSFIPLILLLAAGTSLLGAAFLQLGPCPICQLQPHCRLPRRGSSSLLTASHGSFLSSYSNKI